VRTLDAKRFLEENIAYPFYPLAFSDSAPIDAAYVVVHPGGDADREVNRPDLQVVVRAAHPMTAEEKAWEIHGFLKNKTAFNVGSTRVVVCRAQSAPLYMGPNESGTGVEYSLNFSLITEG
jgi:hypothetical protein